MKCEDFHERISFYMDREMSRDEQKGWEEHLAGCSACRALHEDFQGIDRLVQEIPDPAPLPLLPQELLDRGKRKMKAHILRAAGAWSLLLLLAAGLLTLPGGRDEKNRHILPPITFRELTTPPEVHYTMTLNDSAYTLKVYGEEVTLLSCGIKEKDREHEAGLDITFKNNN